MEDTTDPRFPSQAELATSLPGYRLEPEPAVTTGMSQIYFATDEKLHHRKVAVKIMTEFLAAHPAYRKRFLREIQLMARLEHPNIMHVLAAAEAGERLPYLVMPRAEGDLRAQLENRPLTLARTVHVITQAAAALDHAHDQGVVHRDVKPGNILFGKEDHVYLCDFGVAKVDVGEDLTKPGETVGTNRYTAPEVYGARRPGAVESVDEAGSAERIVPVAPRDRAGDVYSLGAVLYHCLTGKRPFDFADDSAAAAAQRRGELPPVSELRPDLPPALDAVVSKAMDLDPDARYDSCGELAGALIDAVGLTGSGSALPVLREILARLPSAPARTPDAAGAAAVTAVRRFTVLTAVTTLVALLLLAGTLLYVSFADDPRAFGAEDAATASDETSSAGAKSSRPEPVTGDDRVRRFPVVGECIDDDDDDYYVVSCDSDLATEKVYKIEKNPQDPNPSQSEHDDAAWEVCGKDGIDYTHHWEDSAGEDDGGEWDPKTDKIYWIMCTLDVG